MNVSILAFAEINTVTLAITVDFILLMKWNDPRLVFNNLLESVDLNSLSEQNMNQLWTPSLSFSNGRQAEGTVVDSGTLSHVQRAGKRLPDDFSAAIEAQRFYGKDSPIIMEREYFVTFSCYFKLDMYPFDTQVEKTVNFSFSTFLNQSIMIYFYHFIHHHPPPSPLSPGSGTCRLPFLSPSLSSFCKVCEDLLSLARPNPTKTKAWSSSYSYKTESKCQKL